MYQPVTVSELQNHILREVKLIKDDPKLGDEIHFFTTEGRHFRMFHQQDCCESVYIEDINGDLDNLVGYPIMMAEESVSNSDVEKGYESETWTFYRLGTVKGYVNIRWCGSSNGYYSESVDFEEVC